MKGEASSMRLIAFALGLLCVGQIAAADAPVPIGTQVSDFTLRDYHGQERTLSSEGRDKIVVLAFLGTECPLARHYSSRLAELSAQYADRGVVFLGVDSNRQDSVTEIAAFARRHNIEFPIVKDLKQQLADAVGATRTPEVIVLDQQRVVRYRGRIDDRLGFQTNKSYAKPEATRHYLVDAIESILADKPVPTTEVAAEGCLIGRDREPDNSSQITYTKHVAKILNDNCVYCHRENQIGPFTLTSYEDAAGWAAMIDEVVQLERMPPWHASREFGHFENDARLSDADKETIAKWVAAGAPEGDPRDLPEPPQFVDGWLIPEPDQVIYMRDEPFEVPATGVVPYQNFIVDPGWKEDKWLTAIEPRPGNHSVVHHILIFIQTPEGEFASGLGSGNDFLGAFAPGLRPEPLPPGLARLVPANSKLIFQLHYAPNGSPQKDLSYCGFVFADPRTVRKEVRVNSASNMAFQIPPHVSNFEVKSRHVFRDDTLVLTLMPHMHLRGKSFRYDAIYPDGRRETLLDVPNYDFGWQTNYRLAKPLFMPRGSRIDCTATFDNSADNLANPDPSKVVRFGDQTFEEMMVGFLEVMPAHGDRLDPNNPPRELTRSQQCDIILMATQGEPDDNVKAAAFMALVDPGIFRQFGVVLRSMVPQVDRVCISTVADGKVLEVIGPQTEVPPGQTPAGPPQLEELKLVMLEALKKAGEPIATRFGSPLAPMDAAGSQMAQFLEATEPAINRDLSQASDPVLVEMHDRGARSSVHVPCILNGQKVLVNFWSKDPDAFSQHAAKLLGGIAQAITAPKDLPAQAAAN
jgi:peroxiredoxin